MPLEVSINNTGDIAWFSLLFQGDQGIQHININMRGFFYGRMTVEFLDPLGRGGKPSNIPGGIFWFYLYLLDFYSRFRADLDPSRFRGD